MTGIGHNTGGGLVGYNNPSGRILKTWSSVSVNVNYYGGGLVGVNLGEVSDSYATGSVTSTNYAGGLAGLVRKNSTESGSITSSYATGQVKGGQKGGLVGAPLDVSTEQGQVTDSYWDTQISGQNTSAAGVAKTTDELQDPTSNTGIYADWSTTNWDFSHADHHPLLKADFDGDGTATWQEFGTQRSTPGFPANAAIADIALIQDVTYPDANDVPAAFPEPVGGNPTLIYGVAGLPSGLSVNQTTRKITGAAAAPLAKTEFTYKVTDSDGDAESLTFILSVAPKATVLSAAAGDGQVVLTWTAITGVSGWQIKQDSGAWGDISGSSAAAAAHTVTGLTNGTTYRFTIRAVVGDDSATPSTLVEGVASNEVTACPTS